MGGTLETARLLLTAWSDADRALLARLGADPRVARYVGDGEPWSEQRAAEVSDANVEHWRSHGFGWRVAVEKESRTPVGLAALNYLGEGAAGLAPDQFEIGWWLDPSAWGQGFASEAAQAVAQEAFERLGAPSIVARLQPENLASARVATRVGMAHELDTTGRFGEPVAIYRRLAPADAPPTPPTTRRARAASSPRRSPRSRPR